MPGRTGADCSQILVGERELGYAVPAQGSEES